MSDTSLAPVDLVSAEQPTHLAVASIGLRIVARIADNAALFGTQAILGLGGVSPETSLPISVLLAGIYFVGFTAALGGTPGKLMLGLRVVDAETGDFVGFGAALGRWLVSIVSEFCLLLGVIWALFDGRNRTWHDMAVGTLVVKP